MRLATSCRFANDVKGDALYMMELVLSLEKLNFHKVLCMPLCTTGDPKQ